MRIWASAVLTFLLCLVTAGSAYASVGARALPSYNGDLSFAAIHGTSAPEEYPWEVQLSGEQELVQIDDQQAVVYYSDDHTVAFSIFATQARDATGKSVPTSLSVSEGKVVTLTVHHRAGNPAAGGEAFGYPVTEGPAFEVGYVSVEVLFPPDQFKPGAADHGAAGCVVPMVIGRSLKASRSKLEKASCRLGKVRGKRSRAARVLKQDLQPGETLPAGAAISVKLG